MNRYDRMNLLEMARSTQDVDGVIERAKKLEAYVDGGEASVNIVEKDDPLPVQTLPGANTGAASNVVAFQGQSAAGASPGSDPGEPAQAPETDPAPTRKPRKVRAVKAKGKPGRKPKPTPVEASEPAPQTAAPLANGAGDHAAPVAGDQPQMAA